MHMSYLRGHFRTGFPSFHGMVVWFHVMLQLATSVFVEVLESRCWFDSCRLAVKD